MNPEKKSSAARLFLRIMTGILAPVVCGAGILFVYFRGSPAPCLFHEFTGLYCPGCGSGRALEAVLHLRVGQSMGYNALLLPLGLPAGAALVHEYVRFVFPRAGLKPLRVSNSAAAVVSGAVLVFWVFRNLPWFSFLAP